MSAIQPNPEIEVSNCCRAKVIVYSSENKWMVVPGTTYHPVCFKCKKDCEIVKAKAEVSR